MRRIKMLIAAALLASSATLTMAAPAQAMTCSPDLSDACRIAAKVICGVVAKGQPCLN